jgi:chemotaxis signal transduction protein/ABC-type nitrate/sulfonate/bicarbonate transport system substrate-binding protein/CheY-like chemotaxis protein
MSFDPQSIIILLVEDAAVMRNIEKKALNTLGFQNIIEAGDGDIAIQKLQEAEKIDVIISDWNMPNKDGFELLLWVRSSKDYAEMPFIMATGQGDKKQQQQALKAGVNSFIVKPFETAELNEKIEKALGIEPEEDPEEALPQSRTTAKGKVRLKIAHIQITDHLALGVLKELIQRGEIQPQRFELETVCLPSWNPVAGALEKGSVDGACILAPIAMDLYSFNVPIKMVLFAHKNGSIFVRSRSSIYQSPFEHFFRNKFFLIPHKLSVHHMLSHLFFTNIGLKASMEGRRNIDVNFEVVAPIKMPGFLQQHKDSSGFMVAEPIGTKAIASGVAELQFLSGELWEDHPCCVVAMQDDFINKYTDVTYEFTKLMVQAGHYIEKNPDKAAEIAVKFLDPGGQLGLKVPLLKNVLTEPQGIKTGDLYPRIEDLEIIQQYMHNKMGIGSLIDLEKFVDLRFADEACTDINKGRHTPSLYMSNNVALEILQRGHEEGQDKSSKAMLNKEGKYLTFSLADQEYAIDIYRVKEIIGMMDIRSIPQAGTEVKGVINLRDKIIPIIDLRLKFGMEEAAYNDRTCIIVLELEANDESVWLGIAVDTVLEVLNIKAAEIEETPYFGFNIDTNYILAMAKTEEGVKVLLDIDAVMGTHAKMSV